MFSQAGTSSAVRAGVGVMMTAGTRGAGPEPEHLGLQPAYGAERILPIFQRRQPRLRDEQPGHGRGRLRAAAPVPRPVWQNGSQHDSCWCVAA